MEIVFPSLNSPEFEAAFSDVVRSIDDLEALFDKENIAAREAGDVDAETASIFDEVVGRFNSLTERLRTVNAYVHAFVTTDSRNEEALARSSQMDPQLARLRKLSKRYTAWVGSLDIDELKALSQVARDHAYAIEKAKTSAQHMLSPAEEALVSDLELTGTVAWGRLHGNVTSQLAVPIDLPNQPERLPMSVVRSLAYDADRETRRIAYEAELAGWQTVEVPMSAALNSIKGEIGLLSRRRGWGSALDEACDASNIDRATLEAMMEAADRSFPVFRRYLRAKARMFGTEQLAWYDLFAPLGEEKRKWQFDEAASFVEDAFRTYSDRMADFAARSFAGRWTDAEPRAGKRDGAYCMSIRGDESRILMNFKPSFGSVSTLAHELGHAYHNLCLAPRTQLQRATPMTLAETASIFCETIIREAVLNEGSPAEQLAVLDASLQGTTQVVVDITSRFRFESGVFQRRAERELSAREFNELMLDAQRSTYGDGLDPAILHPYMWIVKSHYYGRSYYNFPYMFGLLFGLGLYTIYRQDPDAFRSRYDELLSSTGLADAATLANRFGIDIRSTAFWQGSLRQIEADVERFERLTQPQSRT
ncbi:Oligoendopeptidase F [Fimbriimonas ginsengisoli Gsoil 348]|uniref:Oligoendopeptidase F n=2 Tax=Fimbriimonas ginsengisoli TaxID=1005039 RepID=A0A068NU81_FIMGI|nr:Oligoendopeptidase F [Fimbriimonas ginsengisoli Gsoil 348]